MSLATINGLPVVQLRVQVPDWGAWWADLDCTSDEKLSGSVTLEIGDETLIGTIVSGGPEAGRSRYRVIGGKGGLGKSLPRKPYLDDAGVKVTKVLSDLAREAGETIADLPGTLPSGAMGPHYARLEGVAADTLNLLAGRNWYVDFAGTIRYGKRPTTTYDGEAPRTRVDLAAQVIELATDSIAGLVPGVVVDGRQPATDLEYELMGSRLTVRVYAGAKRSRRRQALYDLVRSLFPHLAYLGAWEYRVLAQIGERLTLVPVRSATNLPALRAVPVRPGIPGAKGTVLPGELVLVTFADPSLGPSRPQVFAHDHASSPGWLSTIDLTLGGPAALPIAYQGSLVQAGPFAGVVTLGSTFGKVRP